MKEVSVLGALLLLLASFAGCVGTLEPSATPPTEQESIFVLGVEPGNYDFSVDPGRVTNGVFAVNALQNRVFFGKPVNGFIVARAPAGRRLAISEIRVGGSTFLPCKGGSAIVFEARAGKVLYLGNVRFRRVGAGMGQVYSYDLARARQHLATHYPALAQHLEEGRFDVLATNMHC